MQRVSDRLKDKVALVTGIGAGIGRECALMFARHGGQVFGCDLNEEHAAATAAQASRDGYPLRSAVGLDLGDESGVRSWIASVDAEVGRADILVNAAAHGIMRWIEDITLDEFRHTLRNEIEIVFIAV